MINTIPLKADMKMIVREPILVLFMLLPVLIFTVFKAVTVFLVPLLDGLTGFDLTPYYGYVLAGALLMTPGMLGTVAGFLMIDERDASIFELMSITPAGYSGYIANRLLIPFVGGMFYTIAGYHALGIYPVGLPTLLYIAILAGADGMMIGLLLFRLADDKVKGLTYSKGLGAFTALAMADLLKMPWISGLAALTPFYWINRLINNPDGVRTVVLAAIVHAAWLGLAVKLRDKG